ncbi:hypothetical protein DSECCO2_652320 [anaerobic digester metagenome]
MLYSLNNWAIFGVRFHRFVCRAKAGLRCASSSARRGSASEKKSYPASNGSPPWNVKVTGSMRKSLSHSTVSLITSISITGDPSSELQQYSQSEGQPRVGISIT